MNGRNQNLIKILLTCYGAAVLTFTFGVGMAALKTSKIDMMNVLAVFVMWVALHFIVKYLMDHMEL